jgi:exopolysaccharide biosynthesis polyprenyl glycosylphosphotransferase
VSVATAGLGAVRGARLPVETDGRARIEDDLRNAVRLLAAVDALVLELALVAAMWLRHFLPNSEDYAATSGLVRSCAALIVVTWMALLVVRRGYSVRLFGAGLREYETIVVSSLLAAGTVSFFCYVTNAELSRWFVVLTFVLGTAGLLLDRWAARTLLYAVRRRGLLVRRVVVVGDESGIDEVLSVLERDRHIGFRAVAAYVPHDARTGEGALPVLRETDDLRRLCDDRGADTVLIARGGDSTSEGLRRVSWALEGSAIKIMLVPSLMDVAEPRLELAPVGGLPLIHLAQPQAGRARGWAKRLVDLAGAAFILLLAGPVLAAVALAIKLEDGGPVLFRQRRVGLHGEIFSCWKLRSMRIDAAALESRLRDEQGHLGALWKMQDDPRVTRVGRFIRRYSLDELPQLVNVLRAEMSLVGPRPQQEWEAALYTSVTQRRLLVRPGMTGLWQVSGRSDLSCEEAVRLDISYVENWSLLADLEILVKTLRAVLLPHGAY